MEVQLATLLTTKKILTQCFRVNFAKFLGTAFFQNNSGRPLLRRVIVIFEREYSYIVKHVLSSLFFLIFFFVRLQMLTILALVFQEELLYKGISLINLYSRYEVFSGFALRLTILHQIKSQSKNFPYFLPISLVPRHLQKYERNVVRILGHQRRLFMKLPVHQMLNFRRIKHCLKLVAEIF